MSVKVEGSSEGPHVTFDLTSKVIDFAILYPLKAEEESDEEYEKSQPTALAILTEEELVMIDLKAEHWPSFYPLPYLNSIHPSAVTCFQHIDNASDQVYNVIKKIGVRGEHSKNKWPISGGKLSPSNTTLKNSGKKPRGKSLLITGHEDGSIRFWDSSEVCLTLLAKFSSSVLFSSIDDLDGPIHDTSNAKDEDDDEWPPFRKVGVFDPYSDDPRLAVKKIGFCPTTGKLLTVPRVLDFNS